MIFTEGNLQIDFRGAVDGRKFDGADHRLTHCMKAVDFVVEMPDGYLFVELKDPQAPDASLERRKEFSRELQGGELDGRLKYKYRDSFLYELASGRADKPIHYFVLIALDTLKEEHLLTRKESLERSLPLRGPGGQPWPREIVRACGVFNLESWNRMLPHYPVNRVGAGTRNNGTSR